MTSLSPVLFLQVFTQSGSSQLLSLESLTFEHSSLIELLLLSPLFSFEVKTCYFQVVLSWHPFVQFYLGELQHHVHSFRIGLEAQNGSLNLSFAVGALLGGILHENAHLCVWLSVDYHSQGIRMTRSLWKGIQGQNRVDQGLLVNLLLVRLIYS